MTEQTYNIPFQTFWAAPASWSWNQSFWLLLLPCVPTSSLLSYRWKDVSGLEQVDKSSSGYGQNQNIQGQRSDQ